MTGTCVIWYDHEPEDHASGYVAHAVLSDGTLAWPIGAGTHTNKALALTDAEHIQWTATGPILTNPWSKDQP